MTFSQKNIRILVHDLLVYIQENADRLKKMNHAITGDTEYWIDNDYEYVLRYLRAYPDTHSLYLQQRKPKGEVCIVLSYNEPFILSVIPILNALAVGNCVTVRPSSKSYEFLEEIWLESGIVSNYKLPMRLVQWDQSDIHNHISEYHCVSFLGSFANAKKLARTCGEYYVEFLPEVEGADVQVIAPGTFKNTDEKLSVESTLVEAFSHAGQSCQRLHGVYVHKDEYDNYLSSLSEALANEGVFGKSIAKDKVFDESYIKLLDKDIDDSKPDEIWTSPFSSSIRVISGSFPDSSFVQSAYFLPTFWVLPYRDSEEVIKWLQKRRFRLGLNIQSKDKSFEEKIIKNTNYARYTVNTSHVTISASEGWGGHWPTGFRGYRQWLDIYGNPFSVKRVD